MNASMNKLLPRIFQYAVAILGVIFVVMIMTGIVDDGEGPKTLSDSALTGLSGAVNITLLAIGICAIAAVLFSIFHLATAGKKAIPTIIGIVGFLIILGIGFAMASDMVMALPSWEGVTSTISKRVGMGLNTFYIMLAIAVGAILFGEVSRFFK